MSAVPKTEDSSPTAALTLRDPLIRLAAQVLRTEIESLKAALAATALDAPRIHAARIAVRRIRVALRLYSDLLPPALRSAANEFRWLGRALGETRDLDVYELTLRGSAADGGHVPAALDAAIARARRAASSRLAATLAAERLTKLLATFGELVDAVPSPAADRRWRSLRIKDAIRGDLGGSFEHVVKLGRRIDAESPPAKLHRLRIRAKRLRYAAEFYAGIDGELERIARAAKQVQDYLGDYRDACLAVDRLQAFARPRTRSGRSSAIAELRDAQVARAEALRRGFPDVWRRFEKAARTARLGRG